jgi:hypothetical protein
VPTHLTCTVCCSLPRAAKLLLQRLSTAEVMDIIRSPEWFSLDRELVLFNLLHHIFETARAPLASGATELQTRCMDLFTDSSVRPLVC